MQKLKAALDGAVKDAKLWRGVCDEAARVIGGTGGVFLPFNPIIDPKRIAFSENLGPFVEHYASLQVGFYDIRPETTSLLKGLGIICHEDIPVSERPSASEGAVVFDRYKFDHLHRCTFDAGMKTGALQYVIQEVSTRNGQSTAI